MTIAGIIFDKDGTLFDFNKTWGVVTKALIEAECAGDVDKMRELAQVLGFDMGHSVFLPGSLVIAETSDVVAEAILPFTLDQDIDALSTRMKTATSNVLQVEVADLQPLFKDLRQRGLKLGIATNDSEEPARANIAQAGVLLASHEGYDNAGQGTPGTAHTGNRMPPGTPRAVTPMKRTLGDIPMLAKSPRRPQARVSPQCWRT